MHSIIKYSTLYKLQSLRKAAEAALTLKERHLSPEQIAKLKGILCRKHSKGMLKAILRGAIGGGLGGGIGGGVLGGVTGHLLGNKLVDKARPNRIVPTVTAVLAKKVDEATPSASIVKKMIYDNVACKPLTDFKEAIKSKLEKYTKEDGTTKYRTVYDDSAKKRFANRVAENGAVLTGGAGALLGGVLGAIAGGYTQAGINADERRNALLTLKEFGEL